MRIDENVCSFHKQSEIFGQFYECVVKTGILAGVDEVLRKLHEGSVCVPLKAAKSIRNSFIQHEEIRAWRETNYEDLKKRLVDALGVTGDQIVIVERYADHIAYQAATTGMTDAIHAMNKMIQVIDEKALDLEELKIRTIICPLTMPGDATRDDNNEPFEKEATKLRNIFGGYGVDETFLFKKGQIGNVDLLFLWECEGESLFSQIFEFSFIYHPEIPDAIDEMHELQQAYFSISESLEKTRFSFAEIEASSDIDLKIQPEVSQHKSMLMSEDKGFLKLMQACSYTQSLLRIIAKKPPSDPYVWVYAKSIVPNSVEQRIVGFVDVTKINTPEPDFNYQQLLACADVYRKRVEGVSLDIPYTELVIKEFMRTLQKLPPNIMRSAIENFRPLTKSINGSSIPGFDITISEVVDGFKNPNELIELASVAEITGEDFVNKIRPNIQNLEEDKCTLRDIHYATLYTELSSVPKNSVKVIFAEGNAGIGKTTAIKKYIQESSEGVLLMYSAPRLKILQEFVDDLSGTLENASGILCVNSNSKISEAANGYVRDEMSDVYPPGYPVTGAVYASGCNNLHVPAPDGVPVIGDYTKRGALCKNFRLVVNQKNTECISELENHAGKNKQRLQETHRDFYDIFEKFYSGVMRSVFDTTKYLLEANPEVNKVALSFAIQGFKKTQGNKSDTSSALDALYEGSLKSGDPSNKEYTLALSSLARLAKRCPRVVIMVDEISGDGAGPALTRALMQKAHEVFIKPFEKHEGGSPFALVFVVADASLCTPKSMEDFLSSTKNEESEKIVVYEKSEDHTTKFFDYQEGFFRLYANSRSMVPCCHIVTNSFPADTSSGVVFNYRMILNKIDPNEDAILLDDEVKDEGVFFKKVREHVKQQKTSCNAMQNNVRMSETAVVMPSGKSGSGALDIISESIKNHKQTIYFLQSKKELADIHANIALLGLKKDEVVVISSDLTPEMRTQIDTVKNDLRLILMTSSAARGISFPQCTHIIAHMPSFHIPSNLMEICQLVYRGRGFYEENGVMVSGDSKKREITLVGIDSIYTPFVQDECNNTLLDSKIRQWYQKSEGLLLCMMISRCCLLTRIKGDAGLRAGMDVIPLGRVGVESYNNSISYILEEFKKTMSTLINQLKQTGDVGDAEFVHIILQEFNETFASSQYSLDNINNCYTSDEVQSALTRRLPREGFGLFEPLPVEDVSLAHLHFKHNFVYQYIPADPKTGATNVGEVHSLYHQADVDEDSITKLRNSIIRIKLNHSSKARNIGGICEAVVKLLTPRDKGDGIASSGYCVQYKQRKRRGVYIVHPLCAKKLVQHREWSCYILGEAYWDKAQRDSSWLDILRIMSNSSQGGFPAIGRYKNEPFLVVDDHPNLYNDSVADGNNFLLSSKLNTLNLLLM